MKSMLRWFARKVDAFTAKYACKTFGDVASLHKGPCERCVGRAVSDNTGAFRAAVAGSAIHPQPQSGASGTITPHSGSN